MSSEEYRKILGREGGGVEIKNIKRYENSKGMLAGLTPGLKGVEYHWFIIMYTGSTMIDPCAPLRPTWKKRISHLVHPIDLR